MSYPGMNKYLTNNNYCPSPELSGVHKISTRYSAINPITANQSIFIDEDQVDSIITNNQQQNRYFNSQSINCASSPKTLVSQLQRANKSVIKLTEDLNRLNQSIRSKGLHLDNDVRRSQYSQFDASTPVSINNYNGIGTDFSFPSPSIPQKNRSYTSHINYSTSEFPASVSQNLNAPISQSRVGFTPSQYNPQRSNNDASRLRIQSHYDGNKTVVSFPFMTYTNEDEEIIDTRANYRPASQNASQMNVSRREETEESTCRRFYVKQQDLEYEEYEDFADPSNNYKQIKYPYQLTWQRIQYAPESIQDVLVQQKKRSNELSQQSQSQSQSQSQQLSQQLPTEQSSQISFQRVPVQQQFQYQQAVKQPNYTHKSSFNMTNLDETGFRSQADTTGIMSASYLTSMNTIPFQY